MLFSLRQLQEKYREQGKPLYVAFINLTNPLDLVSRDGLFKILPSEKTLQMLRAAEAKSNRFQGVVQMTFGFTCGIT